MQNKALTGTQAQKDIRHVKQRMKQHKEILTGQSLHQIKWFKQCNQTARKPNGLKKKHNPTI